MTRRRLPNRRAAENIEIANPIQPGSKVRFVISIGRDPETGALAEVFVNSSDVNSVVDIAARDAATLISIALQHGATVDELASAMARGEQGEAHGMAGALLDVMRAETPA
jgi:hypothetical protein